MPGPAAHLNILVTATTGPASRDLNQLNAQLNRTHQSANTATAAMKQLAKGAALGGVALAVRGAVGSFVDFDQSMRNVNSIAKLSERQFDSLSKRVLKLAGPTAQAPKTLADGLYQLVSSGFDANESMRILGKSAVAATAGLTDTATATQVVAASLNAYGLKAKDAGKVSDILFQTVNLGVVTFEELAQSLGPVLPAANSLNVSLQQVGAAMASLTKQGFPAAEAATAIDNAMRALLKPSEAMKRAFRDLGVSGGEELVRKYGSLQAALEALRGTTDGSGVAMNKLFNQIRGARGAMALTGTQARGAAKDLKAMGDASGATTKAFQEQSKSAAVQWRQLKAEMSAAAAEIGAKVFPIFRRLIIVAMGAQEMISKGFRALGRFLVEVWSAPKRAFGNLIASVLRGMGKLFDLAAKLPGVGGKFKDLAEKARNMAAQVDRMGEVSSRSAVSVRKLQREIIDLKSKRVKLDVLMNIVTGNLRLGIPNGDGWGLESKVKGAIGRGLQMGKIDPFGGVGPFIGGSADLMGANANLGPFAALGARMGLHVSSGYRPGAITSSGNLSYHAMRRAIDMADGPEQMLAYARVMANAFGPKLKELIHSPLGFSIKNGQQVPPYAVADHYDHVHVAMQKGGGIPVPGMGSGDKIPVQALLEPGERMFVLNRNAVPAFDAINRMFPRFQSGGMIRAAKAGRNAGFRGNALQYLLAIGAAESGDYTHMYGDAAFGGSYGPWQVNHPAHPQYNTHRLMTDWTYAAKAAYAISGGGRNWSPWTMFRNGGYQRWMGQAASAIRKTAGKAKRHMNHVAHKAKPRHGRVGPYPKHGDFRQGLFDWFSGDIAMREALAALTPGTADDLAVAQDAIRGWGSLLDVAKKAHDTDLITTAATNLKSAWETARDILQPQAPDDSARVAILQQLLQEANLRTGVSQAQYGVFRDMPAVGAPRFGYQSGGQVQPILNVNFSGNASWLERFVDHRIEQTTRRPRSTSLPGRGGGLQR